MSTRPAWRAMVETGLIAGFVFLVFEMLTVPLFLGMSMSVRPA